MVSLQNRLISCCLNNARGVTKRFAYGPPDSVYNRLTNIREKVRDGILLSNYPFPFENVSDYQVYRARSFHPNVCRRFFKNYFPRYGRGKW